ncbi:MAG TPA: DUF2795 domain-containing protein [Candidatus Paceibacterota bacterium]|nr:DUF2795 domain-containing protein [Candidatus Paceibacterota bacterium]
MANQNTVSPVQAQKFLNGVDYPASKDELIQAAQSQGADEDVIQTLRNIPMDSFNSANDVSEGISRMGGNA